MTASAYAAHPADGSSRGTSPLPPRAHARGAQARRSDALLHHRGSRRISLTSLPDPSVDADVHRVARLLPNRLAELRLDRKSVRAVALRHQRAVKRLAVDRAADLHKPARAEELRRVVHHDARPCTYVVA